MSNSPPPTRYNPNFDFLKSKVKGSIAYHHKSKNPEFRKFKSPTPNRDLLQETESVKFIRSFRTFTPSPQRIN